MVTVEEWINYLKTQMEWTYKDSNHNRQVIFGITAVLIGSILTFGNSVYTSNWIVAAIGVIGIGIFVYFLSYTLKFSDIIKCHFEDIQSLLVSIMVGTLSTHDEITLEYNRIIAEWEKKFGHFLRGEKAKFS